MAKTAPALRAVIDHHVDQAGGRLQEAHEVDNLAMAMSLSATAREQPLKCRTVFSQNKVGCHILTIIDPDARVRRISTPDTRVRRALHETYKPTHPQASNQRGHSRSCGRQSSPLSTHPKSLRKGAASGTATYDAVGLMF